MLNSWFSRFYLVGGWLALSFLDEAERSGGRVWKQSFVLHALRNMERKGRTRDSPHNCVSSELLILNIEFP